MKDRPLHVAVAHLSRQYDRLRGECAALRAEQRRMSDRIEEIDLDLERMRSVPTETAAEELELRRHYNHHAAIAEQQKSTLRDSIDKIEAEHVRPLLAEIRVLATRKAALEKLIERRSTERRREELRREQALMDEIAGRRHWMR